MQNTTKPRLSRQWVFPEFCSRTAESISNDYRLPPLVSRVLSLREFESGTDCEAFLNPKLSGITDPFVLPDMKKGTERVWRAIENKERILVFGDYDVDGISSTTMMVEVLKFLGADPDIFLPHRIEDGYGVHNGQIETFAKAGYNLIVTVDTGVTAVDPARIARKHGVDLVITDHHLAGDELPDAEAVINPNLPDANYPGGPLCGAGVVFKFAHALLKTAGHDPVSSKAFLKKLLDLAALGTIADCVPLVQENRILARNGLQALAESKRPGIRALLEVSKITERPLTGFHIGFGLAPRINACGRMEHPETAFRLLTTEDEKEALALANQLNDLNIERRRIERKILEDALDQVEKEIESRREFGHVVAGESFHVGVVGIVASRLVEQTWRPAIALCQEGDRMKGSARSIPGLDVHQVLKGCEDLLTRFGGHAQAAGLELPVENLEAFRDRFNELSRDAIHDEEMEPQLEIDAVIEPGDFSRETWQGLLALEPFGQDNPEPMLCMRGVRNAYPPKIVGQNHLKLTLEHHGKRFGAIGFRMADKMPLCVGEARFDVCGRMMINEWNGTSKLEFKVEDLRPSRD